MSDPKPLKIIAGADSFGCSLKDTLVDYLRSKSITVEDLPTGKYYSVGEEIGRRVSRSDPTTDTRGLLACGTGVGVSIFANKFPGVYAATCASIADAQNCRSINNSNVLAVSGMFTAPESGKQILDAWLETPFKSPCPASEGKPWPDDIRSFLDSSVTEMSSIPFSENCAICCIKEKRAYTPVDIMPGGSMKIVRESPTSAVVKFKGGSVEPAHHHTFGHDLVVLSGKKRVWNLSKKESYELVAGDYLYTPAPDVHRVLYLEDTEFFIRWDGDWDIFLDEDVETAKVEIKNEESGAGFN